MERRVLANLLCRSTDKRRSPIFIALVLLVSIVGCMSTEVVHRQRLGDLASGSPVQSPVTVGVSSVPLPTGKWILLGHATAKKQTRQGTKLLWYLRPISVTFLGEVVGNELGEMELKKLVLIAANQKPDTGFGKWKDCKRKDFFHLKNHINKRNNQDCWYVSHVSFQESPFTKDILSGAAQGARKYLEKNEILVPINMVYVKYRFASRHDALVVGYYFNPRLDGIDQTSFPSWKQSDWHVSRIRNHPNKYQYLTNLKVWGEAWHQRMKAGFESHAWWSSR